MRKSVPQHVVLLKQSVALDRERAVKPVRYAATMGAAIPVWNAAVTGAVLLTHSAVVNFAVRTVWNAVLKGVVRPKRQLAAVRVHMVWSAVMGNGAAKTQTDVILKRAALELVWHLHQLLLRCVWCSSYLWRPLFTLYKLYFLFMCTQIFLYKM